jgi:hypothetical protein
MTITTNYNSSQSMTAQDSLHSLLDYECLLFHCDWLGSDLRIDHFFCCDCLERRLSYEWIVLSRLLIQSIGNHEECLLSGCCHDKYAYRTVAYQWNSASVRCCGNVYLASRWLTMDFRSVHCCKNVCLASHWLTIDFRSGSTISAFRRHVTLYLFSTHNTQWTDSFCQSACFIS